MSAVPSGLIVPVDEELAVPEGTIEQSQSASEVNAQQHRIGHIIERFGSVSGLIRMGGVAAMIVSMCLFLIDGLSAVNDTQRFMSMLLLTGLLSVGGFILAFLLREQRGARAFFGLALLSVPVNFTVLGALLYSVFQLDNLNKAYPTLAHWQIGSIASLGTTALIAFAALVPVTVLGVSVMAREGRGWLGSALLLSSCMLLIPVRDSVWIAPLVASVVISHILLIKRFGEHIISLKTPAGRFVQCLLFLPPSIMLIRSFWLYEISELSGMIVALAVFAALRYCTQRLNTVSVLVGGLHCMSAAAAIIAALLAMYAVPTALSGSVGLIVFCLLFGALMLELESRVVSHDSAEFIGIASAIILSIAIIYNELMHSGFDVFASGFVLLTSVLLTGVLQRSQEKVVVSGIAISAIVLLNASGIVVYFSNAGWFGFASLGAAAIICASLLERFGPLISESIRRRVAS